MNTKTLLIILLLFYINSITIAYKPNQITEYENGLEDTEKNHTISLVKSLIDRKYAKTSIVDQINISMRQKFGGLWKSLVYETTNNEAGAALLVQHEKQMRFGYGSYIVVVFKLDDYSCQIEYREHLIDRVNHARSANLNLDVYKGIEKTEALKDQIQYNDCTRNLYDYNSILKTTTIYNSSSCFYTITKQIISKLKTIDIGVNTFNFVYSKAKLIIGESFYYSSQQSKLPDRSKLKKYGRNSKYVVHEKTLGFWLGPIYYLMYY